MAEKNIKSRVVLKHDVESNWLQATGFSPLKGEIIIYDVDASYSYERIKIGDGTRNVNDLPFYAGSWEDLSDKPFWSEGPTVIEWPGDTTDLPMSSDGTTYKVSGLKPSVNDIIGGKLTFKNGNVVEITSDIVEDYGYIISIYYNTVFINTTNGNTFNASLGITLPEPGVYLQKNTYNQVLSLSYGEEIVYTLDEKYIPDTIARISDIPKQAIDDALSSTSTNPVQNKAVNAAIGNLSDLVGDTAVSEQISNAIDLATADDFGVYVQASEPTEAIAGDIWIDTINDPSYIIPTLPQVTTADNGKVLMVVNGQLQLVKLNMSIDANGVVSM